VRIEKRRESEFVVEKEKGREFIKSQSQAKKGALIS
jgi:hypothetical protein